MWKIKHNCLNGLFCIANLLEVVRKKKVYKDFIDFKHLQTKMKQNITIINLNIEMTLELTNSWKAEKKNELKSAIQQRQEKAELPAENADIWWLQ